MKLKEAFEKSIQFLKDKGSSSARLDAEFIFGHILNFKRIEIYLHYERPLTEVESQSLRELIVRRSKGEPIAYIVGEKAFYKSNFFVGPGVLTPRPETETLVELTSEWLAQQSFVDTICGVDLGSGTGCIALSVELELKKITDHYQLFAVEKSKEAFFYLEKNRAQHQSKVMIINQDVKDFVSDLMQAENTQKSSLVDGGSQNSKDQNTDKENKLQFNRKFNFVVSNPPYIDWKDEDVEPAVKKYEPSSALFAEDNGLQYLKQWSGYFSSRLASNAIMIFEIGHEQGPRAKEIFESLNCFVNVEVVKDLSGRDRFVKGVKHG